MIAPRPGPYPQAFERKGRGLDTADREGTPALAARGLRFSYGAAPLFDGLDLAVARGAFVGIVGPNGSGKSTLVHLLAGILEPQGGTVELLGAPLASYGRRRRARLVGLMRQEAAAPFAFPVASVVEMGRYPHLGRFAAGRAGDEAIVEDAMALTDVARLRDRPLTELSGGERQRVMFARALAQSPRVLLLDEPTASLDVHHAVDCFRVLDALRRRAGVTVVVVLHDLSVAASVCERVVLLDAGRVAAEGTPAEVFTPDTLERVYRTPIRVSAVPDTGELFIRSEVRGDVEVPDSLVASMTGAV